jgi:hypothetical protein
MYVQRDVNLKINGAFANPQKGYAEEFIADDAPELLAYFAPTAQQIADASAITTAKADAVITYLVTHTPAEIENYVSTNVADLTTAKGVLGKLAVAVSVLAKDRLR